MSGKVHTVLSRLGLHIVRLQLGPYGNNAYVLILARVFLFKACYTSEGWVSAYILGRSSCW